MGPEGVLNWKKHPSHQGRSKYGIFGSFQWEMCTNALFWPSLTPPANPVKFFWSKMACTCVPHIVLHVSCRTRTSGGYFRPSEVRFRAKIPLSSHWFYNVKTQKTHFLKIPEWADFDLLESNCRHIFLHKNQKIYHSGFSFSWYIFSSHVCGSLFIRIWIKSDVKMLWRQFVIFQLNTLWIPMVDFWLLKIHPTASLFFPRCKYWMRGVGEIHFHETRVILRWVSVEMDAC